MSGFEGMVSLRPAAPAEAPPTSTLGELAGATFDETIASNPVNAVRRQRELELAYEVSNEQVDAASARQRLKDEGLEGRLQIPDQGIPRFALETLIDRKRDEVRRQDVFARAPSGPVSMGVKLAVGLGGSLLDPLNVATSFVPVVGEARYAQLLGKGAGIAGLLRRTAVRAGVGAIEGSVGAAALEPFVYASKQADQADYHMADSLANIAFGGVFGAGLHVMGGATGDLWHFARGSAGDVAGRIDPTTRSETLKTAVAQAVSGERVNVDPLVKLDPTAAAGPPELTASHAMEADLNRMLDAHEQSLRRVAEGSDAQLVAMRNDVSRTAADLQSARGALDEAAATISESRDAQVKAEAERLAEADQANRYARRRDRESGGTGEAVFPKWQQLAEQNVDAVRSRAFDRAELARTVVRTLESDVARVNRVRAAETDLQTLRHGRAQAKSLTDLAEALPPEPRARMQAKIAALGDEAKAHELGKIPEPEPTPAAAVDMSPVRDAAEAPKLSTVADEHASADAEAQLKEQPAGVRSTEEDLAAVDADSADELARIKESGIEIADEDMEALDTLTKDADTYGKAARAAVICGLRHS